MVKALSYFMFLAAPILLAAVVTGNSDWQLTGWLAFSALIYMPPVAAAVGLIFVIFASLLRKLSKSVKVSNLKAFLYGFYFAVAAISTSYLLAN